MVITPIVVPSPVKSGARSWNRSRVNAPRSVANTGCTKAITMPPWTGQCDGSTSTVPSSTRRRDDQHLAVHIRDAGGLRCRPRLCAVPPVNLVARFAYLRAEGFTVTEAAEITTREGGVRVWWRPKLFDWAEECPDLT